MVCWFVYLSGENIWKCLIKMFYHSQRQFQFKKNDFPPFSSVWFIASVISSDVHWMHFDIIIVVVMMMMMKYIKDKQNTILSVDFCIGHTQWNQAAVCVWMRLSSVKMVHNSDRAVYSIVINFSTEFFVWILCDTHTQFRNGCTIPMNNFPTKYFVSRSDVRTRRITTSVHTNLAHG